MRPLTPEDATKARTLARRQWSDVSIAFILLGSLGVGGWYHLGFPWQVPAAFSLFAVLGGAAVLRSIRDWYRQLKDDLADGVVNQQEVKIYDRVGFGRHLFFLRKNTYLAFADGWEVILDRSVIVDVRPGNTLYVEYLPRTHVVLSAKKVVSP